MFSFSVFPLKVQGHRGRGANRILAAWPPSAPGAGLRSVGSSSLFFAPRDTSPHPRQLRRGGGGGSWVRLWEREEMGKAQVLWLNCPEESPNASSGWKATVPASLARCDSPESRAPAGRTRVDSGAGRRGGGLGGRGEGSVNHIN